MKPLKYTVAALALIAAASFSTSAKAASTGDLIFGVYDANTGSSTVASSFELDLGAFSTLSDGETWNLGTTVSTLFSSDSSAQLLWDVAGSGSSAAAGGGLAKKEVALTAVTLPTLPSFGGNTTEATAITAETNSFSAGTTIVLPSSTSSNGTAIAAVSVPNGSNSFGDSYTTSGGGFGYGAGPADTFPSTDSVAFYTVLNSTSQETATSDGFFTLSLNGQGQEILTYNTALATPEPSAYALGLCAVALFWVLKRRRSVA